MMGFKEYVESGRYTKNQYKSKMDKYSRLLDQGRNIDDKIEVMGKMVKLLFHLNLQGVKG
tara:strand:+ start:1737 stop:1916 length:180 start_codon:yes stop_codon:yes gene_type:complete